MSIRSRNLLLLLGMLGLAAVESACVNNPNEESSAEKYCRENPTHCTEAAATP